MSMIGFADSEINCGQAGPGVSSGCQWVPVGASGGQWVGHQGVAEKP